MARRPKKHEEEEHENHERWLVSYADMVTLLMCLFIVLFAIATVDAKKFTALAGSLAGHSTAAATVLVGDPSVIEGGSAVPKDDGKDSGTDLDLPELPKVTIRDSLPQDSSAAAKALEEQNKRAKAAEEERQNLEQVKEEIELALAQNGLSDRVRFTMTGRGLIISVVTDEILFDVGSARLRPDADPILNVLGPPLGRVSNDIAVEGHTDNRPIRTAQFPSNWELSTARATSVLRYLVEINNVASYRVGATGFGAERPVVPNDTDERRGQNRRVEIVVLSSTAQ